MNMHQENKNKVRDVKIIYLVNVQWKLSYCRNNHGGGTRQFIPI